MRYLSFIFLFAIIVFVLAADAVEVKPEYKDEEEFHAVETAETTSLYGASRFIAQRTRISSTRCDKNPRICRVKGSPGPDCCKKRCVDTTKDGMNCGTCGNKCRFSEMCCEGKCVNPIKDKKNCGSCNNRCRKGSKCTYGMCNYA